MKQKIIQALPARLFIALKKWGWYGDFPNWESAKKKTKGYDDGLILEKVKNSLFKVKNGEAVYERDSVLFDEIEYSWEMLAGLMWIAAQNKGNINLIDFGGSLGSTYYQNKSFLDSLASVSWNIVEQQNFVKEGISSFEDDRLKFYYSIEECIANSNNTVNCILFSNVLQYLEQPYSLLEGAFNYNIPYIVINKTGFAKNRKERLTVQIVPDKIYEATYPCRFFNENEFVEFFKKNGYEQIVSFQDLEQVNIPSVYKGFIFKSES